MGVDQIHRGSVAVVQGRGTAERQARPTQVGLLMPCLLQSSAGIACKTSGSRSSSKRKDKRSSRRSSRRSSMVVWDLSVGGVMQHTQGRSSEKQGRQGCRVPAEGGKACVQKTQHGFTGDVKTVSNTQPCAMLLEEGCSWLG